MINTETITINGRQLLRTWSDAGRMIERDGARYSEAVDPLDSGRTITPRASWSIPPAMAIQSCGGKINPYSQLYFPL